MKKIRAFVAVELPVSVKEAIYKDAMHLKREGLRASFPSSESYHITLKFLGNIDVEMVERVLDALRRALKGIKAFKVEVAGGGAFPHISNPRVVWCGVKEGQRELTKLNGLVEDALEGLGFEREKRDFHPHVTIGRVKRVDGFAKRSVRNFCEEQKSYGSFWVKRVVLFQSILTPQGAIYKELGAVALEEVR